MRLHLSDGDSLMAEAYQLLRRVSRRAKYLRLEVRHPQTVVLTVPASCSATAADQFLDQHQQWLREELGKLRARTAALPRLSEPGWNGADQIRIRDRLLSLHHVPARLRRPELRLGETHAELFAPAAWREQPQRLTAALKRELREEARLRAEYWLAREIPRCGHKPTALRIGDQRSLWGSCAADGRLSFNWRLLMAPDPVFRYVVIHELCHLQHRNHSRQYWSLVGRLMPDYAEHRAWLRDRGHELQYMLPPTP